jgi:DNA-binding transcriptional regulator YdaS (Cro superfamily)
MDKLANFIDAYGGSKLAADLGVSKSLVSSWRHGRYNIPPKRCLDIERLSQGKVLASELLPEIFGHEARAA